jgi:hypothetical protein
LAVTSRHDRDWRFFYWLAVGFLTSFGAIAILTIGFPFFVLGILLGVRAFWQGPAWPAQLGVLAGIGTTCFLIALISAVDGGVSPIFWALAGVAATALGAGSFWWLRCRRAGGRPGATSA